MQKAAWTWLLAALIAWAGLPGAAHAQETGTDLPFGPRSYAIHRAATPIEADGRLDEDDWTAAPWTTDFVDIEGGDRPAPHLRTRAKMLWDDEALYVAAEMEEPDVWATLTERDAAIYQDNAFEVFIDPDGDTHNYYELEVNALETVWDLMLLKPYRDGGASVSAWDIRGLDVGLHVDGTVNEPVDTDEGWTVELVLPWDALEEAAPGGHPPRVGDQWRFNLARVQWPLTVVDGTYRKDRDAIARSGEDWWVWSPQGAVDLHRPERWGFVQFAGAVGSGSVSVDISPDECVRWALRQLYYRQRDYYAAHGRYAADLDELEAGDIVVEGIDFEPTLQTTQSSYEMTASGVDGHTVHIQHDGRTWTTDD